MTVRRAVIAVLVLGAALFGLRGESPLPAPRAGPPRAYLLLSVGTSGVDVRHTSPAGEETLTGVARVPGGGDITEIVRGPAGSVLVVASRPRPCESRLYRFPLGDRGEVGAVEPLPGGAVPALMGGVAASPDGRRIAWTTTTCAALKPERAMPSDDISADPTISVLDLSDGTLRRWSTAAPALLGELVWARDSRTLGYAMSELGPPKTMRQTDFDWTTGPTLGDLTVYALDTEAPGTELRTARRLLHTPAGEGYTSRAVMGSDGRGGWGMLDQPSTLKLFTFAEGEPIRVFHRIDRKPNTLEAFSFSGGVFDEERYACLNGPDAFGRITRGPSLQGEGSGSVRRCDTRTVRL